MNLRLSQKKKEKKFVRRSVSHHEFLQVHPRIRGKNRVERGERILQQTEQVREVGEARGNGRRERQMEENPGGLVG